MKAAPTFSTKQGLTDDAIHMCKTGQLGTEPPDADLFVCVERTRRRNGKRRDYKDDGSEQALLSCAIRRLLQNSTLQHLYRHLIYRLVTDATKLGKDEAAGYVLSRCVTVGNLSESTGIHHVVVREHLHDLRELGLIDYKSEDPVERFGKKIFKIGYIKILRFAAPER